jgi:hypothetical protein
VGDYALYDAEVDTEVDGTLGFMSGGVHMESVCEYPDGYHMFNIGCESKAERAQYCKDIPVRWPHDAAVAKKFKNY